MLARCDLGGVWHRMPPVDTTLKGGLAPLVEIGQTQAAVLQRMGVNTFIRLQPASPRCRQCQLRRARDHRRVVASLSASRLAALSCARSRPRRGGCSRSTGPTSSRPSSSGKSDILVAFEAARRVCRHDSRPGVFVRTSAAPEPGSDARDVTIALRIGFARAPSEFLTYDFRYHAASLTTEVRPVRDAERHLG
jgi:hypothetical protein